MLAQNHVAFLREMMGNKKDHHESGSEAKPTVFKQLDVSWVTQEHYQSIFHFTVKGLFAEQGVFL